MTIPESDSIRQRASQGYQKLSSTLQVHCQYDNANENFPYFIQRIRIKFVKNLCQKKVKTAVRSIVLLTTV
jgi:hypothetical protein